MSEEPVSEFARRTATTADTKSLGKDNVARLLVFDSMDNTLKPAKIHYDQVCQTMNSYLERSDERYLRECIRRYKIANQNLRLFVFKWGLKELALMKDFKIMTGPNSLYHDSNGRKYQEMGQIMNSKNYFQDGNRQLRPDLPYDPYYSEIWGKVSANTSDRNEAAHEGWDDLATILCSFPKYFVKEIEFWSPLFRTVLGKTIEGCQPPPIEKDLWYDSKNYLQTESITDLFTDI
ncbi:hypothetical protein MMC31_004282 [Peltigera leucophlebia]|nr:hypothetical protein [Peltigera leucophlebia]